MEKSAIKELVTYWRESYLNQKDLVSFQVDQSIFNGISERTRNKFKFNFFPQPFYGYFEEDMKNDVLMPLINPGPKTIEDVIKEFPSSSDIESTIQWNLNIVERHCTPKWTKEVFHKKEQEYDGIYGGRNQHWRGKMFGKVQKLLGDDIEFLHTIEFFPYHSDRWDVSKKEQKRLYQLHSTILAIKALEEIAVTRAVRHIIGIGLPWTEILSHYSDLFVLEDWTPLKGPTGSVGQRIFKFKPVRNPNGLPIVIYTTSSVTLPTNKEAVKIIHHYLEDDKKDIK